MHPMVLVGPSLLPELKRHSVSPRRRGIGVLSAKSWQWRNDGKPKSGVEDDPNRALAQIRQAILTTLISATHGEVPARGPRGGVRWTPRYFVRRLAWHELDHTWEIEDRAE
jgi:hypothetical protein